MKKLLIILLLNLSFLVTYACDDSSASLTSVTDNGNGTYTVVIEVCPEFLGLEGNPDEWFIQFNDPLNVISATPATVTTSTNDDYNLSIAGATATWTNTGFFPSHAGVLCYTATLVVDALPTTTVDVNVNVDASASFAGCVHTLNFPPVPPACSITALGLGTQTPCDQPTQTYTQEIIITYANEPGTGTLDVNGQSFAITSSPQTVTLTNLPADGNSVNTIAVFSADGACTMTTNNLFTAPNPCPANPCAANAGTISN